MPMTVSVVVPTYNRRERLHRVLVALAAQTVRDDQLEVVVVSDGSDDGTAEYLHSGATPLDVVAVTQPNRGPGPARNAGVERASGELIVFIDDDVVAERDLIERHRHRHQHDGGDERLVVIGPMLTPAGFAPTAWIRWEQDKLQQQYDAMVAGHWTATFRQFYTGNASLPRALFNAVGGFDDRFRRAEDVEFSYRLDRAGCRFVFDPSAIGWHYAERSFRSWLRNARDYGVNDVVFARDHDRPELLAFVRDEFPQRNAMIRAVVQVAAGRPRFGAALQAGLNVGARAAARARLARSSSALLSATYNLAYYRGVADELGGADPFRDVILAPAAPGAVRASRR